MIRVSNYFSDDYPELNRKVERYVNSVLQQIVRSAVEMHNDAIKCFPDETSYVLEAVCPKVMLRDNPKLCENKLLELYDLICSDTIRIAIHPIYQYILFHCIEFDLDFGLENAQEFCPIDPTLKEGIEQTFTVEADDYIDSICNTESYLEWCFRDWDFLPGFLNEMTNLSILNPDLFLLAMNYDELDEYLDLMDADLRDDYLQFRAKMKEIESQKKDDTLCLIHDVFHALCATQRNPIYIGRTEDEISDGIRDMLRISWEVYDQTRQGTSESGTNVGEVDFIFAKNGIQLALAEALKMDSMNESQLSKHITKAIDNYNPVGYPLIFLFMYVTAKDFGKFWEKCLSFLQNYDYQSPALSEITDLVLPYTDSKQAAITIERSGKPVEIHFFAIHLKG